jgi:adenine-specific DNA glycosylase
MRDDRATGYATENVVPPTAAEVAGLLDIGEQVRRALDPDTLVCPIRDCKGHEGPHGSLWAETWTS